MKNDVHHPLFGFNGFLGSVVQNTTAIKHQWRSKTTSHITASALKLQIVVSQRKEDASFSAEVEQQPDNSVPQPKPINIPSCTALSLLSDQHTHKLHWQPCWRSEINSPIVWALWLHWDASLTNAIWFDCFGPTVRKTTRRRTKTK